MHIVGNHNLVSLSIRSGTAADRGVGSLTLRLSHLRQRSRRRSSTMSRLLRFQLSIPIGTIYNWCYLRRIPFIKAGRFLRFDAEEVIRLMPRYAKSDKPV